MRVVLQVAEDWWPALAPLFLFGFAPRAVLRLIVRAYPRGSDRREEMVAELDTIKRIEKPIWVAEQLEMALFEGLPHRVRLRGVDRNLNRLRSGLSQVNLRLGVMTQGCDTWGPTDRRFRKAYREYVKAAKALRWIRLGQEERSGCTALAAT